MVSYYYFHGAKAMHNAKDFSKERKEFNPTIHIQPNGNVRVMLTR